MFELMHVKIQNKLLLAVSLGVALCLVPLPAFAQTYASDRQNDAEIIDNQCPVSIDYLMIGNLSIDTESRFNSLVRVLNSSSECNYDLDLKVNQISRLLDEAYEDGLVEQEIPRSDNLPLGGGWSSPRQIVTQSSPQKPKICDNDYISRIWGRCQE